MNSTSRLLRAWGGAAFLLTGLLALCIGCRRGSDHDAAAPDGTTNQETESIPVYFRDLPDDLRKHLIRAADGKLVTDLYQDMTGPAGLSFSYRNGEEAGHMAILESLGGGVGLIDFDGDGLLDVFIVGGGYFDGPDKKQIKGLANRLYRNLGGWKFQDVTHEAGLDQPTFYGHGAAVADYDRDGWPDLLVTGWGRLALYHNEPDGKGGRRFRNVAAEAGLPEGLWTTSAAWGDLDGDGYPDLYVCQYVNWSFANHPECASAQLKRDVCPPEYFAGLPHKLFRNKGNGTFQDVSREAGLRPYTGDQTKDARPGKGLGVLMVDIAREGKPAIYVANDGDGNFLYVNHSTPGHIRLEEVADRLGVARDDAGSPTGSMGTDAADYDGSGRASLWCTNFQNQVHGLYRNQGHHGFLYASLSAGMAALSRRYIGFGTGFLDLDNHGCEDLIIANGHVMQHPAGGDPKQLTVLLRNGGLGRFSDITRQGGDYFRTPHMGRGLAIGDLDNDGRPDLVISHANEPVAVLRNQAEKDFAWLGIDLVGKDHRDVVGATVTVEAGGRNFTRFAKGGGSYLSSSDRRMLFGLGRLDRVTRISVHWPGNPLPQIWDGKQFSTNCYWKLREGQDVPEQPVKTGRRN